MPRHLVAPILFCFAAALVTSGAHAAARSPGYGKNGMVVSSSADAARAGAGILAAGGNAIDAAVATAASVEDADAAATEDAPADDAAPDAAEERGSTPTPTQAGEGAGSGADAADVEAPAELIEVLVKLLGDTSPSVLGSAAGAFEEIAPHRLDLLHPHFHALVRAPAPTTDE